MQDPIFTSETLASLISGTQILATLNARTQFDGSGPIGWHKDKYDSGAPHGAEFYFHTRSNFGAEAYFSMKVFNPVFGDPTLLQIWCNTGFDTDKRVDNQPGMFAKTAMAPSNAPLNTEVFSGDWDDGGANADPTTPGDYKTSDGGSGSPGSAPVVDSSKRGLWFPQDGGVETYDAWLLYDPNQGSSPAAGGSRVVALVWYIGNAMCGFVIGKVLYDDESPGAVDKTDGHLLTTFQVPWDSRNVSGAIPSSNSLGGELSQVGSDRALQEIIRPQNGWPSGSADGSALALVGTTVLNEGALECGDELSSGEKTAHHRPDQGFDDSSNTLQPALFPNPQATIYFDPVSSRRAFCRHRYVARANGGAIDMMNPPTDWRDSGFYFPWYFAPTSGKIPGDTESNGTRRYILFPGSQGGDASGDDYRYAGIAFRLSDGP